MDEEPHSDAGHDRILILAGFRGAGKSTLLASGVQHNLPVFGEADDAAFREIRLPGGLDELAEIEDAIERGTWLTCNNLVPLVTKGDFPRNLAVHLDLLSILHFASAYRSSRPEQMISSIVRGDGLDRLFIDFAGWFDRKIASRYRRRVVNTLLAEPAELRRRLALRGYDAGSFTGQLLAEGTLEAVHERIYAAWFGSIGALRPDLVLHCRTEGAQLLLWPDLLQVANPSPRPAGTSPPQLEQ